MKYTLQISIISAVVSALVVGILIGQRIAPQMGTNENSTSSEKAAFEEEKWTCSMHPQIQQNQPGACPICGMDLIPVLQDNSADVGPRSIAMSESARALAEIQTSVVERRFPEARIRLVGKLSYDETRIRSLTARFPGRIDELFVNYTGVLVQRGDPLAMVYSPELNSAQSELLTAHRTDPDGTIARSAREKLLLWDLLPEQINDILEGEKPLEKIELKAPVEGIVSEQHVREGDYIRTGQTLMKIVDLDALWLELDAYESDLGWLRSGQRVDFTVESFPGETFSGSISFIEPELDPLSRTTGVRVDVDNTENRLKPGMFARGIVLSKLDEGGRVIPPGAVETDRQPPLVVPLSAVLKTGTRAVVYLEREDNGRKVYEGREVALGPRAGEVYLVYSGLEEGDVVVSNGAFKIDSALQIQAKPSMMNPPRALEEHSLSNENSGWGLESVKDLLPSYFSIQKALAGDDLEAAKEYLKDLMLVTGHSGNIADLVHLMLAADTLESMRRPHFEVLSNLMIEAVKKESDKLEGTVYRMNCSMVYPDRGADWLQDNPELVNPYWGSQMLHCGTVEEQMVITKDNTHHEH